MIRTQIYLPEELYKELKLIANVSRRNFSEVVRAGANLLVMKEKKARSKSFDPWKSFIGKGSGGPKDLSSKIDYYLYDEPYKVKAKTKK